MQLVRDIRLHLMTQQLLPPSYSKTACRKLPPFKSSLKDGRRSVFLIFQDSKVEGQCKLRAEHHIAASAASLRFTWGVPDARWHHKECRNGGKKCFSWFFSPSCYKGLEFTLWLWRAQEFLMTQLHPLLPWRAELWRKEQSKVKEKNPHLNTFIWSQLHYDLCNLLIRFFYW